jgi:hypothetical protein
MVKMNTLFKTVAWIGLLVVITGSIMSFSTSWTMTFSSVQIGVDWGHAIATIFGIAGLVLMLIGGIISRPKYFWIAAIIAGLFYTVSFFSIYPID